MLYRIKVYTATQAPEGVRPGVAPINKKWLENDRHKT